MLWTELRAEGDSRKSFRRRGMREWTTDEDIARNPTRPKNTKDSVEWKELTSRNH